MTAPEPGRGDAPAGTNPAGVYAADRALRALRELLGLGAVRFTATGHSMTPAIRSGDRLTVEPLRRAARVGEVLACDVDGRLVVHRLVSRRDGSLVLRGDVAPSCDPFVADTSVLGIVTRVERCGHERGRALAAGRLIAWLSRNGLLRASARLRERLRRHGGGMTLRPPRASVPSTPPPCPGAWS